MSTTPDTNPLPVVSRKRDPRLNIPRGQQEETLEEWQERQNRLQAQHAASLIANKERERLAQKAARERKRYLGLKTSSERIDNVEEISPAEAVNIAAEIEGRQIIPPRGPHTDGGSTLIDEGEVPIARGRTKKMTKVEAARAREQDRATKKAKTRKVVM
jgi:hypothetical protein